MTSRVKNESFCVIYIVMGVSGCGKSTVGKMLGEKLSLPFYDADDYHFPENIEKMENGIPLTDADRKPWLTLLANHIAQWESEGGAVLACSALKKNYRDILRSTTDGVAQFIYLKGDKALLTKRLKNRGDHFMPESLLQSQLNSLEPPKQAITVLLENALDDIISHILKAIKH
jgi:gluconokinase